MERHPKNLLRLGAAVGTAGALLFVLAAPAVAAAGANASAFGLKATGLINIAPTAQSVCPPDPGSTASAVPLTITGVGTVGVLNSTTTCNQTGGASTATGGAANLDLLASAVTADAISSQCSATAPATPTGSTTVANLKVLGVLVNVPVGSTTPITINIPLVATVTINEQITNADGSLTVNALHVTLLGNVQQVIIGSSTCGPNTAAPPIDSFSFQNLPIILGSLAIVALLGYGASVGIRRARSTA